MLNVVSPHQPIVMSICESEMSEMKSRVCGCALWKAHQGLFNVVFKQQCSIIFSDLTNEICNLAWQHLTLRIFFFLKKKRERATECARLRSSEKLACGKVFTNTSRSDREALVHHHAISRSRIGVLFRFFGGVSGRVFLSEDRKSPSC